MICSQFQFLKVVFYLLFVQYLHCLGVVVAPKTVVSDSLPEDGPVWKWSYYLLVGQPSDKKKSSS